MNNQIDDFEKNYVHLDREFKSLKSDIAIFGSIVITYAIRFFILDEIDAYVEWVKSWDGADLLCIPVIFFISTFLMGKFLDSRYKS